MEGFDLYRQINQYCFNRFNIIELIVEIGNE